MFSNRGIVLLMTLFGICVNIQSLVELTPKGYIDMSSTEIIIRDTFNKIFTALRIRNVRNKPQLKENANMHNVFVSIAIKDCESLKEIESLSRVYDVDNVQHYVTLLNKILNETEDNDVLTDNNYETMYVEPFIKKLRYLKEIYNPHKFVRKLPIDTEIVVKEEVNTTKDARNYELWVPSARRVYRGRSADISLFPFMASIHALNTYRCGGTIIQNDFIITSATCIMAITRNPILRGNINYISIRVGSSYTKSGGELIEAHGVFLHHGYNPLTLEHNIALVKLSRPIRFDWSTTNVKRIDFDKNPTPLSSEGRHIILLGWGAKKNKNLMSHQLAYSVLSRFPRRMCQKVYGRKYVTFRHFCGGSRVKKGGACRRDIGRPGIIGGHLVGIINFASDTCGAAAQPTVFTKLGFYTKWIEDIIGVRAQYIPSRTISSPNQTGMMHVSVPKNPAEDYITMLKNFKDVVSEVFARKASEDLADNTNKTVIKLTLE